MSSSTAAAEERMERPAEKEAGASPANHQAPPGLDKPAYRAFYSVPVEIVVCVGKARTPIGQLFSMGRDAVIVLDQRIDDPVEIRVGDRVVAWGELQELDDGSGRLGVRLTEIVDGDGHS